MIVAVNDWVLVVGSGLMILVDIISRKSGIGIKRATRRIKKVDIL